MNGMPLSEEEILAKVTPGTMRPFACMVPTGTPTAEDYEAFQPTVDNIMALVNRGELTIEDLVHESSTGSRHIAMIAVRRRNE